MTIKTADNILNSITKIAMVKEYDIDNDINYINACRIVTEADLNKTDINGLDKSEFAEYIIKIKIVMEE